MQAIPNKNASNKYTYQTSPKIPKKKLVQLKLGTTVNANKSKERPMRIYPTIIFMDFFDLYFAKITPINYCLIILVNLVLLDDLNS